MKKVKTTNELEELKQKAGEYLAGWQRTQAEWSNYRKQAEKEKQEFIKYASSSVSAAILPVIDNFDRALSQVPADQQNSDWVKGISAIESQLFSVLQSTGVTKIDCVGKPFDPIEHEAVMSEHREKTAPDEVIEELEPGYKLNGKVIRPAKVKISK